MKAKGNILLETIVSVMILILIITIFHKFTMQNNLERERREIREEISRVQYCIMEELKYNFTIEEIKSEVNSGNLNFLYYKGLLEDLTSNSILSLPKGDGIKIVFSEAAKGDINIKINIKFTSKNMQIDDELTFVKAIWMENVYED